MGEQFQKVWNGHFGQIDNAIYMDWLSSAEAKPIYAILHRAGPKAGEANINRK